MPKGFPGGSEGKESACNQETGVRSLDREDTWRREWQSTPVFFPGEFHGQRSQAGYSLQGREELAMTKMT